MQVIVSEDLRFALVGRNVGCIGEFYLVTDADPGIPRKVYHTGSKKYILPIWNRDYAGKNKVW
jgi:hypothetical protein